MHGHDRLRLRRDPRGDVVDVDVHGRRVDVGEDRCRADTRDRLGCRIEGERGADHLVAATDAHRLEAQHERVGAVGDTERVRHAEVGGGLLLERLDLRAEDEAPGLEHVREAGFQLGNERRVLRLDVDERNHDARV